MSDIARLHRRRHAEHPTALPSLPGPILIKGIQHLRISYYNRRYSKEFWSAPDIQAAAQSIIKSGRSGWPASVFVQNADRNRVPALYHNSSNTPGTGGTVDRRLRQECRRSAVRRTGLAILATIGSISPFVGLFGTVWGIMGALTSISKSGSASLKWWPGRSAKPDRTAVGIAGRGAGGCRLQLLYPSQQGGLGFS